MATSYAAKLWTGDDSSTRAFGKQADAIRWLTGEGLVEFGGYAERAEVTLDGSLIWTKSDLATPEYRALQEKLEATRVLSKLGL